MITVIETMFASKLSERFQLELKVYKSMVKSSMHLEYRNFEEAKTECKFLISIISKLQPYLNVIEKA